MTVRDAQAAAGVTIVATGDGSGPCVEARVEGTDLPSFVLLVEPAGPEADLLDGVVRRASRASPLYEAGGSAYGVFVTDDMVLNLQSGDPAWLSAAQGCPPAP